MLINEEELINTAALVRLSLTDEEKIRFSKQLNGLLHVMQKLNDADVTQVERTTHGLTRRNVMRDDEVKASLALDKVFLNAPEHVDDQFKVPAVLD